MPNRPATKKRGSASKGGAAKKRVKRKYLVFISHSSKDSFVVGLLEKYIKEKLGRGGVETYLDMRDLEAGDDIALEIKEQIQQCNEVMVFLTKYSASSQWVLTETGAAWGLDKRIVVIIDKVTPEEMPKIVVPFKRIDVNDFDTYIKQLSARAQKERSNDG